MTEEKGFVIRDRRFSSQEEEGQAAVPPPEAKAGESGDAGPGPTEDQDIRKAADRADAAARKRNRDGEEMPLPTVNFATFVVSLSSSVLVHLGEIEDPESGAKMVNPPMAKQTIDILGMLEEKTRGNLSPDEEHLLRNMLYDLRMRYVRMAG